MRIKFIQKLIDKIRGKKKNNLDLQKNNDVNNLRYFSFDKNKKYDILNDIQIIATRGFYYSGSSALIGFFSEFDNAQVVGYVDNKYSKNTKSDDNCEFTFFSDERSILNLVKKYYNGNLLEQDLGIKQFIDLINSYYRKIGKNDIVIESNNLYDDKFYQLSKNFLLQILELDEQTKNIVKTKIFPSVYDASDDMYKNCCFCYGCGSSQYIMYKFKKMNEEEFNTLVKEYIYNFFKLIFSQKFLVCDQLCQTTHFSKIFEKLNMYIGNEIKLKEICIYRDPRDQFLSAFRNNVTSWYPRNARDFISYYLKYTVEEINLSHKDRLVIRFEDFVLNYDETSQKIMDFCGLKKENHVAPKSIFDPEISKVNIGAWKDFYDQDFMKQIGEALKEYCYEPDNM